MADPVKAPGGKGLGETLKRKVGPFPLGVWLAAAIVAVWYFRKQQAAQGQNPAATQSQTGYGTDPAGNTGYIDPQSGYVYGSAEDIAALQNQGLVAGNSYNTGGTGATSGTGASGSTDTSGQTTGSTNGSGTSTTTPGAPPGPTVPAPGASSSSGKNWHYPAPSGLTATNVSDSGFGLTWQPVQGPQGQKPSTYTVQTVQLNGVKVDQFTSGSTTTKEYGAGGKGLKPGWQYRVNVWANGGPQAPAHASTVVTVKAKGAK
jgi:Fibronectin type III domain